MENFDPNKTPKKQILSAQIDLSKFERATDEEKRQQDVMSESTSFFKDGMRKLFKNPLAVLSIVVLAAIILTIIIAPMIVPYGYEEILSVNGKRDKGAKNLAPFEIFVANLEAKNQEQLMIRDLVESYGLKISAKRAPGHICAVSTLEAIYSKYGYQVLNRVLRLIIGTWEGDSNSFSANIMNAVTKLCVVYKDQLKDEVFSEKLGAVSIKQLTRTARDRRKGSMGFAEAMLLEYNGKRKSNAGKLFMNKLYARDVSLWIEPDENEDFDDSEAFENFAIGQLGEDEESDNNESNA